VVLLVVLLVVLVLVQARLLLHLSTWSAGPQVR